MATGRRARARGGSSSRARSAAGGCGSSAGGGSRRDRHLAAGAADRTKHARLAAIVDRRRSAAQAFHHPGGGGGAAGRSGRQLARLVRRGAATLGEADPGGRGTGCPAKAGSGHLVVGRGVETAGGQTCSTAQADQCACRARTAAGDSSNSQHSRCAGCRESAARSNRANGAACCDGAAGADRDSRGINASCAGCDSRSIHPSRTDCDSRSINSSCFDGVTGCAGRQAKAC